MPEVAGQLSRFHYSIVLQAWSTGERMCVKLDRFERLCACVEQHMVQPTGYSDTTYNPPYYSRPLPESPIVVPGIPRRRSRTTPTRLSLLLLLLLHARRIRRISLVRLTLRRELRARRHARRRSARLLWWRNRISQVRIGLLRVHRCRGLETMCPLTRGQGVTIAAWGGCLLLVL